MSHRGIVALSIAALLAAGQSLAADGDSSPGAARKKVLVELYTSQGCDSCPSASDLLGRLAGLGYGPDRIVPVGFHVDYFNQPWVDPYSDPSYSRREASYNAVQRRDDLYFTPMLMVDGRYPMLGSDKPKVLASIERALKEPAAVGLEVRLDRKALTVKVAARSAAVAGRELLVGVAVTEDPVSTKVASGENGGKTLVEHAVVRSFVHKPARLERGGSATLSFPIELAAGQAAARSRVAIFVQDHADGRVYQAESIPWEPEAATVRAVAARDERPGPPAVGDPAKPFDLTALDGQPVRLDALTAAGPVVLVVLRGYPGYQCPICTGQFGSLLDHAPDFDRAGASVVLVYPGPADGLRAHAGEFVRGRDLPRGFVLATDPDYAFTNRYGLRWDAEGETAYPATFVIDRSGIVRFAKVSRSHEGRATAAEIVKALGSPGRTR